MENIKKCVKCHLEKNTKFYGHKCSDCYNQERATYYHIKKKKIPELLFVHTAINDLLCCEFTNNLIHKQKITDIIVELNNIIDYYS